MPTRAAESPAQNPNPDTSCLPPDALAVAERYLSALDEALPGRFTAFIVTGSMALGDYRAGSSDLDFLAVSDSPLDAGELSRLAGAHRAPWIRRSRPVPDGCFATREQLAGDPRGLVVPRVREGVFVRQDGYAANPVAWCIAARHPLRLRGARDLGIRDDDAVLRAWCRSNLAGYWSAWVRAARNRLPDSLYALRGEAVFWGVTGVSRIHSTIATGSIVSKRASIELARQAFGRDWGDILDETAAFGENGRGPLSGCPARRRERLLAYMERVIRGAAG